MRFTAAVVIACCTYSTRALGQSYFPPASPPPIPARQVFLTPKDGPQVRGKMFEVPTPAPRLREAIPSQRAHPSHSLWEQKISKRKGQVTGAVTTAAIMAAGGALLFLAAAASGCLVAESRAIACKARIGCW